MGLQSEFDATQTNPDAGAAQAIDALQAFLGVQWKGGDWIPGWTRTGITDVLSDEPGFLAAWEQLYGSGTYNPGSLWLPIVGLFDSNQGGINRLLFGLQSLSLSQLNNLGNYLSQALGAADTAAAEISSILNGNLPQVAQLAQAEANDAQANAEQYTNQEVQQEAASRQQADQAVQNQAYQWATQAESQATDQFNQAESDIAAERDRAEAAEQQLQSNLTAEQNRAETAEQQAEQDAVSQANGYTDGQVRGAEALAAAALAAQVASDAAEFAVLTAGVEAVADLAGDALLAGALSTLITDGLLFGFLAAAIKFPQQTADASVAVVSPLTDTIGGLLDSLIGVVA